MGDRIGSRGGGIAFVCDACDRPIYIRWGGARDGVECDHCRHRHALSTNPANLEEGQVQRCLRCGLDRLYVQKDFNKKIGLGVFAVAAILSVPTWGLSLLVATLIDLGLYYLLGDVTICYSCSTQHRGFQANPEHGAFDLHVAEAVDAQPTAI